MDLTSPVPIPGDLQLKPDFATIVTVLERRAVLHPEKKAFTFLANGTDEEGTITYAGLDAGARIIALNLTEQGLKGSTVLMFYPPGLDFIIAFFGCLYSGVIPVPLYPPRKNRSLQRIHSIAISCKASSVLTTNEISNSLVRNFTEDPVLKNMSWHATDNWMLSAPPDMTLTQPGFEELAFLQYTSGSTGNPKGVMISHRNLMYNLRSLQLGFRVVPEDNAVHWAPQFHDLGLITGILETVFSGSFAALIPPVIFISNPLSLLRAITRYHATMSEQPDFAFNHCVDKIAEEDRMGLDLSHMRIFYSGAEPVRKSTFDRFFAAFSSTGLKAEALIPAYGMAEATLMLTGATTPRPPFFLPVRSSALEQNIVIPLTNKDQGSDIQWIASNGKPSIDTVIRIVDPETREFLPAYKVGEIWASGNSITMGYFDNPLASESVLRASPAGQDNPVWIRTGDLGFMYNEEVFITGRLKDLIIINGRNFYPQDIEEIVEASHPSIRKTCSAAFSLEYYGKERLAIIAELGRTLLPPDTGKIIGDIVSSISREFEIQPMRITLIEKGSVIKTSSGKIMRRANRESLLGGKFEIIADRLFEEHEIIESVSEGGKPEDLEKFLIKWVSLNLNKGLPVDPSDHLSTYAIDSIRAIVLVEDTLKNFGFEWPPYLFFEDLSIAELAEEGKNMMHPE